MLATPCELVQGLRDKTLLLFQGVGDMVADVSLALHTVNTSAGSQVKEGTIQ